MVPYFLDHHCKAVGGVAQKESLFINGTFNTQYSKSEVSLLN